MQYIILGFIFGLIIPYLTRRFAKFMPATFAYALYRIIKQNKQVSYTKRKQNYTYQHLKKRYIMRSLGWGIVSAAFSYLISITFSQNQTPWLIFFSIILFLLMEIDKRTLFLPDLLTVPLLFMGFAHAVFAYDLLGDTPTLAAENSALGAIAGYFIPVIASLVIIKKHPDAFGGGDIKLLSAIGAWQGIVNIPFVILLSCVIFAITCFINKERQGAYGPSIVISSIIIMFFNL